jgi:hypothetical protein
MGQRTWREMKLRSGGRVPEREGCIWTPVFDYLTPGKTYRLEVEAVAAPAPAPTPPAPAALAAPAAPVVAAAPPAPEEDAEPHAPAPDAEAPAPEEDAEPPAPEEDAEPPAPEEDAEPHAPVVAAPPHAPGAAPAPAQPAPAPVNQTWQPEGTKECTADGETALDRTVLLATAPAGALIAKIGGSSADTTVDKVPLFAVGRHCVFTVEAGKAGTLYLGVNDAVGSMARLTGHLTVKLWEAL